MRDVPALCDVFSVGTGFADGRHRFRTTAADGRTAFSDHQDGPGEASSTGAAARGVSLWCGERFTRIRSPRCTLLYTHEGSGACTLSAYRKMSSGRRRWS